MSVNNPPDKFFDLYKQNIACYYNNKKLLKIINEGTSNIPPTVGEMLIAYETNSEKIKGFDNDAYLKHHKMVKTILCRLFNKDESKQSLFGDIQSNLNLVKSSFVGYMEKAADRASGTGAFLSQTSSRISSRIPSLELPTDKRVGNKINAARTKVSIKVNKLREQRNEWLVKERQRRDIKKKYEDYLDTIAKEIFQDYVPERRGFFRR